MLCPSLLVIVYLKKIFHLAVCKIGYGSMKRTMTWQVVMLCISVACKCVSGQLQYSIPEELKKGFVVGNMAKDLGLNVNELQYRNFHIVSHAKKQYFEVSLENGNLQVSEKIDREALCGAKETCFINLEAVIENPLNLYTVKVEIVDVNDVSPSFFKDTFDILISESALLGTHFILGLAQDQDLGTNSVQGYKLSGNEYFTVGQKISTDGIHHPELVLEKSLDREKQSSYELILTAYDGGNPSKTGTATLNIVIQDVNDNSPVFSQDVYQVTLEENAPKDFVVLQLNAIDIDDGSNAMITYSLSQITDNVLQIFTIDPTKGIIKTIGDLDFELTESYQMSVEATDGGGLASHCKVMIQIIDINDNAPEIIITSVTSTISEDSPPGTVIALVKIHDLDSGENGQVTCQIDENIPFEFTSTSMSYFKLLTRGNMDRETNAEYNITITASDKGSPQLSANKTIRLIISDVNDNAPIFEKANYIIYVAENNSPGTSIYNIHASDSDLNENRKIVYSVLANNKDEISMLSYISINSMTGVLYAQHSFDYEQLREFKFQVMAKDSGSPPLSENVTVNICIIDQNDNAPRILYPSPDTDSTALFEFIPRFSGKDYLVTKIIAVDADSGHNAWLSYHLLQVPEPPYFSIGQHTGEIRVIRDFDKIDNLRQRIIVLAKDNGTPSLSATVTLNLVVAENFQQVHPEITKYTRESDTQSNGSFYLIISIALISFLFVVTVMTTVIFKCRKSNISTAFANAGKGIYPHLTLTCPSQANDGTLPLPFPYELCVAIDSSQNEFAYLKPIQNVPTDTLIDTEDSANGNSSLKDSLPSACMEKAQPNADWRFSQAAQKPGPSGTQPTEEAGVWPNNQFETERLQAMILASANEAAEGTSGLGGGTGTMGLSARYGPQFTLQHVPDYRQNVYIPGSTLTPTNGGGKREGKGNKKKSSKKDKK
ncbi:protocadherin gamma subfamily A, 3 L homeolog isoform X5 [Xenopus laevis]|uniref:Protocadherin gamma subfamily A, 3 L homeolog isoform X5 n=1 Tax=Xenopus laevis TaxID=8355 RepID=A0A8J1MIE1_XENLA|nr:protocadherin gamma subfamily A, 3 L homeolog isoform X5 [Xenopus laevis]